MAPTSLTPGAAELAVNPADTGALRSLLEATGVGVAIFDADLRYRFVNAPLAEINGVPADHHLGRRMIDVLPDLAEADAIMRSVLDGGEPVATEITGETPAAPGRRRTWRASYTPLDLGRDGPGVGCVVIEISDRVEAEAAARDRLSLLDSAEEAAGVGTFVHDLDSGTVRLSRGFATMHRLPEGTVEVPAAEIFRRIHDDDRAEAVAHAQRMFRTGGALRQLFRVRRDDGAVRWMESHARMEAPGAGHGGRVQVVAVDITERRHAENLIASLQARTAALGRVGNTLARAEDRVTIFEQIVGELTALGVAGAAVARREPARLRVEAASGTLLALGDTVEGGIVPLGVARSGIVVRDALWGDLLVEPGPAAGEIADLLAADFAALAGAGVAAAEARDGLRRANAELEERVRERTHELRATVAELEAFSYSVSHDLRGPLRAMHSAAELLEEGTGSRDDRLRRLRLIREAAEGMDALIEDLLEVARLGKQPLRPERVAMDAVLQGVLRTLPPEVPEHMRITIDPLPVVAGNPALLHQLLANVLGNAVKFTRDAAEPAVHVGYGDLDGSGAAFFVRDNGIGFRQEHAERAFGLFQRLHADERFEGTGAGLAIVRRVVERHGGRVWATSEPGRGATIAFVLPLWGPR
ncbi:MAG: PAS domain-containing protein [Thermoleophilia bacterium]|nr:PAS domain-containing protein [Thermoleophilia bacterium]